MILLSQLDIASLFSLGKRVFHKIESQVCLKTHAFKKPFATAVFSRELSLFVLQRTVGKALVHQTKLTMRGSIGFLKPWIFTAFLKPEI